mgnify:CR=1 FL=1
MISATTPPGMSIAQVIDEAGIGQLRQMLGNSFVDVLEGLDPSLASGKEIRKIAKKLYGGNNPEPIRQTKLRNQILDLLPIEKARELAEAAGIEGSGNVYRSLKGADLSKKNVEDAFMRFFGITEEARAPDLRKPTTVTVNPSYGLFFHQKQAAKRVHSQLSEHPYKTVLHMPTGAGKTRTAMHIICDHLRKNGPTVVCWLANSTELLHQAADAFEEAWAALGDRSVLMQRMWGEGNPNIGDLKDGILIAGFAKLYAASRRQENLLMQVGDRASLTVVDEAHQAIAATYRSVIEGIHTKRPRNALLGLTATPGRTWADVKEDEALSDFFAGQKVTLDVPGYEDPVSYLIDEGYLARPRFRRLDLDNTETFSQEEYAEFEKSDDVPGPFLNRLGDSTSRNLAIVNELEALMDRHKRILVFATSVEHAELLTGVLTARGHEADVVTGNTPKNARERLVRKFQSDKQRPIVLCNYGVLTTGFDAPKTSAAVIARPTKSLVLYSQMVGRATRGPKAGGNVEAEIVTVVDTGLPGFGDIVQAFHNWEDVWDEPE